MTWSKCDYPRQAGEQLLDAQKEMRTSTAGDQEELCRLAYVRREFPEWSWSASRHRMFSECRRRYYYHYYAAHNGWEKDAPRLARQAYRLKNLTNLHLTFGTALHLVAAYIVKQLQSGRDMPSDDDVRDRVRNILNDTYRSAHQNRHLWEMSPKRHAMLHEVYYEYGPSQNLIDAIKEKLDSCIPHLMASLTLEEIKSAKQIVTVDSLDHFHLVETKVYAAPDALYQRSDGTWVIVDWKTGDEDDDYLEQLRIYALYAKAKHAVNSHELLCRLEYLNSGDYQELAIAEDDLRNTERGIARSMTAMRSCLLDAVRNEPHPMESFPLRLDRKRCSFCNFYELCQPALEQETTHAR